MDKAFYKYIPNDDIYLFNIGKAQKAWLAFGCNYIEEINSYRFVVWAPNAREVSVVGSFNGWDSSADKMTRCNGGVFVCFTDSPSCGDLYKYCITQQNGRKILKADPFAAFSQNGSETASIVWKDDGFSWNDEAFLSSRSRANHFSSPMSIYELHLGSWRGINGELNYRTLAERLAAYCLDMGYTHIELMPITEYPFDGSWGYQVTGYYAPTSRYGDPTDFKFFVNYLHRAGIGVIIDWVPAHFPKDEHGLASFDGTPLFECKERRMAEHPEWGTLIFDYASHQVQSFLISSACCFFEKYHIDGIRVDAVSSMIYLDYARKPGEFTPNRNGGNINLHAVEFLKKLNSTVMINYPGAITIAEESSAYPMVTAPPQNGGLGFCFKWDMGFMHDTLDYMQSDPYFRSGCHSKITFSMMYAFSENYILAYSHDEVVHGKHSMLDKMFGNYEQKFSGLRALYGFQYAHPGKKLTFMGSEFGQFIEWNWKQPLDWLLLDYPMHDKLRAYSRELNIIYKKYPALWRVDRSWDGFKWLNVNDNSRSSVAFMRMSESDQSYIVAVSNFTPVRYDGFVIGLPYAGTLHEVLNSDDERFGGTGFKNKGTVYTRKEPFQDLPNSAKLTLPPLSTVMYEFKIRKGGKK